MLMCIKEKSLVEPTGLWPACVPLDREIIPIIFHSCVTLTLVAWLPHSQRILSVSVLFVANVVSFSRLVFAFSLPYVFICLCFLPFFPFFLSSPGPTHLCLIVASYPLVYLNPHPLTLCTRFSSLHSPVLSSLILLTVCL